MMRASILASVLFAVAGCAAESDVSLPEASLAVAAGGEAPVITRLRTRSGVRDVTVHDLATTVDGHAIGTMRAWAGTDESLMQPPSDDPLLDPVEFR